MFHGKGSTWCFVLWAILSAGGCDPHTPTERTITVIGKAELEVPPDHLVAWMSVATVHNDPATAMSRNEDKIRAILGLLRDLEIDSKDVSTGYLRLEERFDRGRQGEQVFKGFEAETTIQVAVRDLGLHERLIKGSLDLGMNRIWGVSFRSTEIVEKHRRARRLAIRAAREKAEYLAKELGHDVGAALTVTEKRVNENPRWAANTASNTFIDSAPGDLSPDIGSSTLMPEMITVTEEVEVVFRLEGGI
jgi:hypothetical protein